MEQNTHLNTFDLPNRSPQEFKKYQDIITDAVDWAHKNKDAPDFVTDEVAADIIIISFLVSDFEWWSTKFLNIQRPARVLYRDPDTFWRTIAMAVSTPQVKQQCLIVRPDLNREKYFPYEEPYADPRGDRHELITKSKRKSTHKRGDLWRLDNRWDHLWPSSRKVFQEIRRRTQYPKRLDDFPWSQTGIESLVKFTKVSEHQVRRALHQLERFGLIKRIFKGNTFLGASKYLVFITPSMSGAFKIRSLSREKHSPFKKQIPWIS